MINTAVITRKGDTPERPINNDDCLEASYIWNGKVHILTVNNEYLIEKQFDPKSEEGVTNRRNTSPAFFWYGAHFKSKMYQWEENTENLDGDELAESKNNKKIVYEFWKNHPHVMWNGKQDKGKGTNPCTNPAYNITIESDKTMEQENIFNKQNQALMSLNELDYNGLCDAMYFFGHTPQKRTALQMKMFLGDLSTGILFARKANARDESNVDKFLRFCDKNNIRDIEYHVNMAKAIDQGLIAKEKSGTGDVYKLDGTVIAASHTQLIGYMRDNPQVYNVHIKENLKETTSPGTFKAPVNTSKSVVVANAEDYVKRGWLPYNTSLVDSEELAAKVENAKQLEASIHKVFPDAQDLTELAKRILVKKQGLHLKSKGDLVKMILEENAKK